MMTSLLALLSLLSAAQAAVEASTPQFVTCKTTASDDHFVIELKPEWSPLGVARFVELVKAKFFDDSPLFRVVKGFLVQFGIAGQPHVTQEWRKKGPINDDPRSGAPPAPFLRGYVSFAGSGANSRTTELFINYRDSTHLGNSPWETPIGLVKYGMDVVDSFYAGYGDVAPFGNGPKQSELYARGNLYVDGLFPNLDKIESCSLMRILGHDDDDGGHEGTADEAEAEGEDGAAGKQTTLQQQDLPQEGSLALTWIVVVLGFVAIALVAWRCSAPRDKTASKFHD